MLGPAEIAALVEAGLSATELAERAGVHLRTAYKWLRRHRPAASDNPPAPPTTLPDDFDRAKALNAAINQAIAALPDQAAETVERLARLARVAKLLGLREQTGTSLYTHSGRPVLDALAEKLGQMRRDPPASPGAARKTGKEGEDAFSTEEIGKAADSPSDPGAPPAAPVNPWLVGLQQSRTQFDDCETREVHEPPLPTRLMQKPINGR